MYSGEPTALASELAASTEQCEELQCSSALAGVHSTPLLSSVETNPLHLELKLGTSDPISPPIEAANDALLVLSSVQRKPKFASSRARQRYEMETLRKQIRVLTEVVGRARSGSVAARLDGNGDEREHEEHQLSVSWKLVALKQHMRLKKAIRANQVLKQRLHDQNKLTRSLKAMITRRAATQAVRSILGYSHLKLRLSCKDQAHTLALCLNCDQSLYAVVDPLCPSIPPELTLDDHASFRKVLVDLEEMQAISRQTVELLAGIETPAHSSWRDWRISLGSHRYAAVEVLTSHAVPFRKDEVERVIRTIQLERSSGKRTFSADVSGRDVSLLVHDKGAHLVSECGCLCSILAAHPTRSLHCSSSSSSHLLAVYRGAYAPRSIAARAIRPQPFWTPDS